MEISISTGLYYTKDYKEILDIISASNCRNIELFLNQAFIDLPIEVIKSEIVSRDLNVTSIHLPLSFIAYERGENEEFWIKKGIEYLNILNAEILVTHFFYKNDNPSASNDKHFDNIKNYSNVDRKFICTENLPNNPIKTIHQKPKELIEFLSVNNCYMTFDTTHSATHCRNIIDEYKLYRKYIRNIHLSDFKDGNEHKILGDGVLPIRELLEILKEDNYKFPLTLEFDFENPKRNKVTSNEEAIDLINKSLKYIEEIVNW